MRVLLIYREERFSPASVEKDRAILDAVAEELKALGHETLCGRPETITDEMMYKADAVLSMARGEKMLHRLDGIDAMVLNNPNGIRLCSRRYDLDALLRNNGIAIPPTDGPDGVWIKRGDGSAEVKDDIVVGDSIDKDIIPAKSTGCQTAWLKGEGWTDDPVDESIPDIIISDLSELYS